MEYHTIRIPILRTPSGEHTCATNWDDPSGLCPMLRTRRMGLQECCALSGDLQRVNNTGYLIPSTDCPIKA